MGIVPATSRRIGEREGGRVRGEGSDGHRACNAPEAREEGERERERECVHTAAGKGEVHAWWWESMGIRSAHNGTSPLGFIPRLPREYRGVAIFGVLRCHYWFDECLSG